MSFSHGPADDGVHPGLSEADGMGHKGGYVCVFDMDVESELFRAVIKGG